LIAPSGYLFAVKIRSRSGVSNDLIITSRCRSAWFAKKHSVRRSLNGPQTDDAYWPGFGGPRSNRARKHTAQIGLAAQSGPRFDADQTAGSQTNDADSGQAFG
jgi:hypothetical protein